MRHKYKEELNLNPSSMDVFKNADSEMMYRQTLFKASLMSPKRKYQMLFLLQELANMNCYVENIKPTKIN